MDYSVKNIERILLAEKRKIIKADTLNENTKSTFVYLNNSGEINKALQLPEYQQAIEAYKNGHIIYRGMKEQEENTSLIVTPGTRKSKHNANTYTKFMSDILPSWREYPRRDKSTICSNNYDYAKGFSYELPFIIFPQNNTKIGICPENDIWYSFQTIMNEGFNDLSQFSVAMIEFFSVLLNINTKEAENLFLQDRETLLNAIHQVNLICRKLGKQLINDEVESPFSIFKRFLNKLTKQLSYDSLISVLDEYLLSPKENGFKLGTVEDIPTGGNHEIWFEGQHLMIRSDRITFYL